MAQGCRTDTRWSKEEDDRLLRCIIEGTEISKISTSLGRTEGAIRSRMKRLGLRKDMPAEVISLLSLGKFMDSLFHCDHYVAKSEYIKRLGAFHQTIGYFLVLRQSGMLSPYCRENSVPLEKVEDILSFFEKFEEKIEEHNEAFISRTLKKEKKYLDTILKDMDPDIILDMDQRRAVLTDEDYSLVVAGAGAGKTTTVAAKVKYLVDKQNIDPGDILVISFTNKAVGELKERIQGELGIACPIATFHSTGNAIIRKHEEEKMQIAEASTLYYVIREYFRNDILKDERMVKSLILFFASYFDAPFDGEDLEAFFLNIAKANYSTMKSEIEGYSREIIDSRTHKKITIQSEVLRSMEEVVIANYLYLHGIDYEYEPVYPYHIPGARKPYTPDFILRQGEREVYLEHFGISEDGTNSRYTQEELNRYKQVANDKVKLHKNHGTPLIYTFSSYRDGGSLTEHLEEKLSSYGFVLTPRSSEEIMEKLVSSEENRYIRKLVMLITRFIRNFKVGGYGMDDFSRMRKKTDSVRSRLFLEICEGCFMEYQKYLRRNHAVDFEDMINTSVQILKEIEDMKEKLTFRYVIVDEYQDISRQRFDLVKALKKVTDAKIMAVGDDWQSIYAFSGSDITLFTKFREKMGYAKLLKIVRTYRNSQEVIDIAGSFIQKNDAQIKKSLISDRNIENPVIIYTYDSSRKKRKEGKQKGSLYNMSLAVETALGHIAEHQQGKRGQKILLIGRYGFDGDQLERSGLFEYVRRGNKVKSLKYPKMDISFMTAHASKGLGYDNVIIINGKNETYGFPSKIEDDPVLYFVMKEDRSIDYAEERRLFYVAMTRTKNRVYFIAPEQNPSEFLIELKKDYKNVSLVGSWNEQKKRDPFMKRCPICGFPLQYRYKEAYGLKLFLCTNEPEICSYMTNELGAAPLSIQKCDQCVTGYLIARKDSNGNYFLGCTNYKKDQTGCSRTISRKEFMEMAGMTGNRISSP